MNTYRAGQLNKRITITSNKLLEDGAGGYRELTKPVLRCWAHVRRQSANEAIRSGSLGAQVQSIFVIRNRSDIREYNRIVYQGQTYNILGFPNPDAHDIFLEIEAELFAK